MPVEHQPQWLIFRTSACFSHGACNTFYGLRTERYVYSDDQQKLGIHWRPSTRCYTGNLGELSRGQSWLVPSAKCRRVVPKAGSTVRYGSKLRYGAIFWGVKVRFEITVRYLLPGMVRFESTIFFSDLFRTLQLSQWWRHNGVKIGVIINVPRLVTLQLSGGWPHHNCPKVGDVTTVPRLVPSQPSRSWCHHNHPEVGDVTTVPRLVPSQPSQGWCCHNRPEVGAVTTVLMLVTSQLSRCWRCHNRPIMPAPGSVSPCEWFHFGCRGHISSEIPQRVTGRALLWGMPPPEVLLHWPEAPLTELPHRCILYKNTFPPLSWLSSHTCLINAAWLLLQFSCGFLQCPDTRELSMARFLWPSEG